MALTLQPTRGFPQHSGETGTQIMTAIHRHISPRFFLRGKGHLYTGYPYPLFISKQKLSFSKVVENNKLNKTNSPPSGWSFIKISHHRNTCDVHDLTNAPRRDGHAVNWLSHKFRIFVISVLLETIRHMKIIFILQYTFICLKFLKTHWKMTTHNKPPKHFKYLSETN